MKEQVKNCSKNKTFKVDIKQLSFPLSDSGIVWQEWCGEETSQYPEGSADLCTDINRLDLICHNIWCKNQLSFKKA